MEGVIGRAGLWFLLAFAAIAASVGAQDTGFAAHALIIAFVAFGLAVFTAVRFDPLAKAQSIFKMPPGESRYDDDVVRWGVLATMFWGLAGLLAGLFIALQMAFPVLNVEPFLTFGRVRPLHRTKAKGAPAGALFCMRGQRDAKAALRPSSPPSMKDAKSLRRKALMKGRAKKAVGFTL